MKVKIFFNSIWIISLAIFVLTGFREGKSNHQDDIEIRSEYINEIKELANHPLVLEAFEIIKDMEDRTLEDHIKITEIPAPPFMEYERAKAYMEMITEAGIDDCYIDEEGNVIGIRQGIKGDKLLILSAHLDTVFPEGTDVTVRMSGDTLFAPGIGDDSRGLAVVLTVLRAMNKANIETEADVWFVGTVGEEGLGDLRGVKHIFRENAPKIDAFISVDLGGEKMIVNKALGSRRYRVTFSGPGGHSWGAFGLGNPVHAMGRAIRKFDEKAAIFISNDIPRTSYNVGQIGGGTSVNSIPYEAWMEVDMRSIDHDYLLKLDEIFLEVMEKALHEQNQMRLSGVPLEMDIEQIGDRPSGEIDPATPLIQRSIAAVSYFGFEPRLTRLSTDSNIPISMDIPAVTLAAGGEGGGAHSLEEWWLNRDSHISIQRMLLITIAEAGLAR